MRRIAVVVSLFLAVVLTLALVIPVMAKNGNNTEPTVTPTQQPLVRIDPPKVEGCLLPSESLTMAKTVTNITDKPVTVDPVVEDCPEL